MWDIHSTTEMLRAMSAANGPKKLFQVFVDHVRRTAHVDRALILSRQGLSALEYRVVRSDLDSPRVR
jgi:hypothetical protein